MAFRSGDDFAAAADTVGQLWMSALQMTVLPLVFSLVLIGLSRRAAGENGAIWRGPTSFSMAWSVAALPIGGLTASQPN